MGSVLALANLLLNPGLGLEDEMVASQSLWSVFEAEHWFLEHFALLKMIFEPVLWW